MIPFITSETTFRQNVFELLFSVDIVDLDSWVHDASIKEPVQRNSVGSGYVSHRRTSALDNCFSHCFVVLKDIQHSTGFRVLCIGWNEVT